MKTLFTLAFVFFTGISAFSQDAHVTESQLKQLPSVNLKEMNGKSVNTGAIGVEGPIIISFWATWCAPCKKELNTIHELYEDWQAETGVTLVAVSIDDEKTKNVNDENESTTGNGRIATTTTTNTTLNTKTTTMEVPTVTK